MCVSRLAQTGDVAQWLESRNSNPRRPCVRSVFCPSESTLVVQTCLCLTPFMSTARTRICAHVKYPTSICRKSRPHSPCYGNTKTLHTGGGQKDWVAPYYGCSLSLGKSSPNLPCIALGQESFLIILIYSNHGDYIRATWQRALQKKNQYPYRSITVTRKNDQACVDLIIPR